MEIKTSLVLTSDLTSVESAFIKADNLIQSTTSEINGFGKDVKKAFDTAVKEVDQFNKELQEGEQNLEDLEDGIINVGKSVNKIKELRKEMKQLTSEALEAGAGTEIFRRNLEKVGQIKDEISDLNAVIAGLAGNIGENLAGAVGNAVGLIATGFEGATAAASLFGVESEEVEKQILKLQALQSLANVAKELGGLADKLTEIKTAIAPLTDGLANLYTSGNEGLKKLGKEGFGGIFSSIKINKDTFKTLGTSIVGFVKTGISGFKSLGSVIAANPFGIVLVAITAIITAMVLLRDKVKPIAVIFEFIGDIVEDFINTLEELGQALGIVASDYEKSLQSQIDKTEELVATIGKRYDREIKYATAAGKATEKLEKEKAVAQAQTIGKSIAALEILKIYQGKLDEDQLKKQKELNDQLYDLTTDAVAADIKAQTEARKKADEEAKKRLEDAKKAAEKLKQLQKDLQAALLDLAKRAAQAQIALSTGEERILKQRQFNEKELDEFRKLIIEKGKLIDKNFKLSIEQEGMLATLRLQIERESTNAILQEILNRQTMFAELRKKEIDDQLNYLQLSQKLAEEKIKASKSTGSGFTEVEFEAVKQKALLQVQIESAKEQLSIKKSLLAQEAAVQLTSLNGQIDILEKTGGYENQLKAKQLGEQNKAIKKALDIQEQIITLENENLITGLQKQIDDIDKKLKPAKINWAVLLGITPEQMEALKQGINNAISEIGNAVSAGIALQQQQLDFEIAANDKKIQASQALIDQRQQEIDSLNGNLQEQKNLQQQGLANNASAIAAQIAAKQQQVQDEQALQDKQIEQERKLQQERIQLQRQQETVDTITQGVNLLTAATNIYKNLSPLGPLGIGIAAATITAMLTGFVAVKAKAFQAINQQQEGFYKGGYTGDGGKYEVAGPVHKGEFVFDQDKTQQYWDLFHGLQSGNKPLIENGLVELLKGTKVTLPTAKTIAGKRDAFKAAQMNAYYNNDTTRLEGRIGSVEERIKELIEVEKQKSHYLNDGSKVEIKGNVTRYTKK